MIRAEQQGGPQGGGQGGRESSLTASLTKLPAITSNDTDQGGKTKIPTSTPKSQETAIPQRDGLPPSLPTNDDQTDRQVSQYVTRTARTREHLFALYRSGRATDAELQQAHRAYDEADAEGVQAVVDAVGALTDEQRHTLAVLLAPTAPWNPTTVPRPRKPID